MPALVLLWLWGVCWWLLVNSSSASLRNVCRRSDETLKEDGWIEREWKARVAEAERNTQEAKTGLWGGVCLLHLNRLIIINPPGWGIPRYWISIWWCRLNGCWDCRGDKSYSKLIFVCLNRSSFLRFIAILNSLNLHSIRQHLRWNDLNENFHTSQHRTFQGTHGAVWFEQPLVKNELSRKE